MYFQPQKKPSGAGRNEFPPEAALAEFPSICIALIPSVGEGALNITFRKCLGKSESLRNDPGAITNTVKLKCLVLLHNL